MRVLQPRLMAASYSKPRSTRQRNGFWVTHCKRQPLSARLQSVGGVFANVPLPGVNRIRAQLHPFPRAVCCNRASDTVCHCPIRQLTDGSPHFREPERHQFIIGSYLEPRLTVPRWQYPPFAVIFAVFFWSFERGKSGAFIGVPIPIAFIVYSAGTPSGKWVATLLSGGSNADTNHGP